MIREFWRALPAVGLILNVCNADAQQSAPDAKLLTSFKQDVRGLNNILRLPGLCIAVVKNGNIVYSQSEGYANLEKKLPMTADYMFQIASVTKTFTANLLMQYEQEHKASINDYALNYRFIDTRFGYPYNVDANARISDFVSHISEDGPGNSFVYNGQRFNYIYGVFEKVGGYKPEEDAYSAEIEKRIFQPLQMRHSITGFPDKRSDELFSHIATPYFFDRTDNMFKEDTLNYRWTKAFPATGIISTISDLARYTSSYDTHQLITSGNYDKITTPRVLKDGSSSPYGIGWFTEEFAGKKIHWHYGHADSYASLLVRVPETGYTFILLSNSNAPSEALRLGSGHIWQSPFVTAFLKYFVLTDNKIPIDLKKDIKTIRQQASRLADASKPLLVEQLIGYSLYYHYADKTFGNKTAKAKELVQLASEINPERFERYEPSLIFLLTDMNDVELQQPLEKLIAGYEQYNHIQPYTAMDIAHYYENNGNEARAVKFYRQLADAKGFETWPLSIEACIKFGKYLIKNNEIEKGRAYYWRAVNSMKMNYEDIKNITSVITEMNTLTASQHLKN